MYGFADLLPGEPWLTERGVFRDKKVARNEPVSDRPAAVQSEYDDRDERPYCEPQGRAQRTGRSLTAAKQDATCQSNCCARDDPAFVPRHAQRGKASTCGIGRFPASGLDPFSDQCEREKRRGKEQRFGHR